MADRISTLPDPVLCYILSFLPTKVAVITSVLSKRWNPLWLSVPTLHLDYAAELGKEKFTQSVYSVILSRDLHQSIRTFRLSSCNACHPNDIKIWINAATQRGVEHLDIDLRNTRMGNPGHAWRNQYFNCVLKPARTLVVLKLKGLTLKPFSHVDFPLLKVLHLNCVKLGSRCFAELLSRCPVLEDLEAIRISLFGNYLPDGAFKRLSKLVRANIYEHHVPLEAVSNVEFLCINFPCIKVDNVCVPVFHNVTHIELAYTSDWLEVVIEVLKQCPKLQVLVIDENKVFQRRKDERGDWPYPQSVPESISLHLKACHLKNYKGWEGEFQFARYIMQNARHLRSMTFCFHTTTNEQAKNKMIDKLFLCTRLSGTCKLSFK